jgi:hypothetical protein
MNDPIPADMPERGSSSSRKRELIREKQTKGDDDRPEKTKELPDDTTLTSRDDNTWEEKDAKDPNEVEFDGPDDPFNPLNQPIWRKWVSVFTVASGAICL